MFGIMNITLPSEFTGGALYLQYGNSTQAIAFLANSSLTTTAVGSFVNMTHTMGSVTSRYRYKKTALALFLKSWNIPETAGKTTVLACVTADEGDALRLLYVISPINYASGYHADMDYTLTGSVTFERRQKWDWWGEYAFYDYEEDLDDSGSDLDEDPDDYEMPSHADEVFDIVEMTDLSGMPINIPDSRLLRSSAINGRFDSGEVIDQSYEHDYYEQLLAASLHLVVVCLTI
ncbi:hypothetical protein DFS33DRAFT_1377151 [Desarmillaria ectypa]|nr:hypothetical protein DFS33DRAFT_1377151 [Desarmillaria ectypa]